MSGRRTRLIDCNPRWANYHAKEGESSDAVWFDCPEGHTDCEHLIPFTPALDGSTHAMEPRRGWQRKGDTFETLTLSPSIRRTPVYADHAAAIAAGAEDRYLEPTHFCALHIFIRDGQIEFCGDSR